VEKYNHETQLENFVTDMLWALVNNMRFQNNKRYCESNTNINAQKELNGKAILDELINAW